jgi:predicted Zn-dependent peptidase
LTERKVVIEELKMSKDDPSDILYDFIHSIIFNNTTLADNILGSEKSINTLSLDKLKKFRNLYYKPDNSVLDISGGFEPKKTYDKIKNKIYSYPKTPLFKIPNINKINKIVEIKDKFFFKINKDLNQTLLAITFKSYHKYHDFNEYLELIEDLLSSGSSSRLFNLLRNKLGVTYFNYSSNMTFDNYGFFMINIGVDTKKVELVIEKILEELKRIKRSKIKEDEFNKIKKIRQTGFSLSLQDPRSLMKYYGLSELFYEPRNPDKTKKKANYIISNTLKRMKNLDLIKFNKVVSELFVKKNMKVFVHGPKINKSKVDKILDSF